jgi:hypothetical protein
MTRSFTKRLLIAVVVLVVFLSGASLGKEQKLLTATNDEDESRDTLLLDVDSQGRPGRLIHRRTGHPERRFSVSQLREGVVLRQKSGQDLLLLKLLDFDPERAADIKLTYLYSGLPPARYKSLSLELERSDGKWSVYHGDSRKPVESMRFLGHRVSVLGLQKTVGIREVRMLR